MTISQRQFEAMVGMGHRHSKTAPRGQAADQQVLIQAARLARRGRYDAATGKLAMLPADTPLRPSALDLEAKIFAQQGRYLEAEACWREALTLAPDNPAFQRALAAIAEERRYPFWLRIAVTGVVAAATSIACIVVVIAVLKWTGWLGR